jgi:hypothetical protein
MKPPVMRSAIPRPASMSTRVAMIGWMPRTATRKPFHAPALVDDPAVERRVDELGAKGGPLAGII